MGTPIPIIPDDSTSVFKFQQCRIGSSSLTKSITGFDPIFESYASIECKCFRVRCLENLSPELHFRILNRLCRGRISQSDGGENVLMCNLSVVELEIPTVKVEDFCRVELILAKLIMRITATSLFDGLNLTTTCDHIKLLKVEPLKFIKVVFITSTYTRPLNSTQTKILAQNIRTIFQTYDIRLRPRTLVDLRNCPLSKSFHAGANDACSKLIIPEFIFVSECQLKNGNYEMDALIGRVNSQTKILVERVHHVDYYSRLVESSAKSVFDFAGVERVFEILSRNIHKSKRKSQGLLLSGPSGSGKTLAVSEAAKVLQANLLVFKIAKNLLSETGSKSGSQFSTTRGLNEIFTKAIESGFMYPTILLIEGLDFLNLSSGPTIISTKKFRKSQAVKQKEELLKQLWYSFDSVPDDCSLTIVVTTTKPHLCPTVLRTFPKLQQEVTINVPDESTRSNILKSLTSKNPAFTRVDLNFIAQMTPGFVGADLMRLVGKTDRKMKDEKCNCVSESHIKYALANVYPSALQGSVGLVDIQRTNSLDHIVGLASVKLDLIKAIVWPIKYPHSFTRLGCQPSKGILLYGPPGCGKTTLVRALAASHQTNFLSVSAAGLFSSGVGDSEKIVAHLFHRARMASPCILFLDELDSIVGSRDSGNKGSSVNDSILTMLLQEMDGIGNRLETTKTTVDPDAKEQETWLPRVIVVGATNRPNLIDSALLRPGRFDRVIAVPPPNEAERLEFLQKSTEKTPVSEDVDLEKLARETVGYSGADLDKLVREAALFAMAEDINRSSVSMEHYIKAKAEFSPSVSLKYLRSFYEYSSRAGSSVSAIQHLTNELNSLRLK